MEDEAEDVEEFPDDDEPTEDDYVYQDANGCLVQFGKVLFTSHEWDEVAAFIREHAAAEQFYPSVWQQSDHGNNHRVTDWTYAE